MKNIQLFFSLVIIFLIIGCKKDHSKSPIVIDVYEGSLITLGANYNGVLGDSTEVDNFSPYLVPRYYNICQVAASRTNSMFLSNNGYVYLWGDNSFGQLGLSEAIDTLLYPSRVQNIPITIKIESSVAQSVIIDIDSCVWIWGKMFADDFQQDIIFDSHHPIKIEELSQIVDIDCGGNHCIALDKNGDVWTWGRNVAGALGDGSTVPYRMTPTKLQSLSDVIKVSAGGYSCLALLRNGEIYSWGYNLHGELGNGTNNNSRIPVKVNSISNAIDIATGSEHSLCLTSDNTVYAWGENLRGQLGNNSDIDSNIPVQVAMLSNVEQIDANGSTSIAKTKDGKFWSWGNYKFGTIPGGYSGYSKKIPTEIKCLKNADKIYCGGFHYLILKEFPNVDTSNCFEDN